MNHTPTIKKSFLSTREFVTASLVAAIMCIIAPFSIPIPISPVPISLTNLIICISAYLLSWQYTTISYTIYLCLGLVGLPVFSGFTGGFSKLAGPTGGYLIGFLFLAAISGFFIQHFPNKPLLHALGMIIGSAITNLFGTFWLMFQLDLNFMQGLSVGVLPYLAGDILKIIIACIVGPKLKKRIR